MLFQKLLPSQEGIQGYRTGKRKASESPWSHTLVSDLYSFCFTGAHYWACVFLMCVYTHWKRLSSVSFTVTLQDTLETSKTIWKCKEKRWESQNYFWRQYSARVRALKAGRLSGCRDVVTDSLSAHHAHGMASDCHSLKKETSPLLISESFSTRDLSFTW